MTRSTTCSQSNLAYPEPDDLNKQPIHLEDLEETNEKEIDNTTINKLQTQLTQIQLQLTSLQKKQSPAPPMPHPTPPQCYWSNSLNDDTKDKKSPTIQPFFGDPQDFDRFLAKINRAFLLAPRKFSSDVCCVVFTCQHLEGHTASWAEPILIGEELELQEDWQKFFMAFWEHFRDPNIHDHLTERLYSLRQTQSVRKYALDFENLARKTAQPHSTWGNIFYRGLKDNVKDLLVGIPCRKSNYEQLKRAALEADECWVFRRGENQNCSIVFRPHTTLALQTPLYAPPSAPPHQFPLVVLAPYHKKRNIAADLSNYASIVEDQVTSPLLALQKYPAPS